MSTYAFIRNDVIVEFKEISDSLYASWVAANNPKKDSYKLVVYTEQPSVSSTEIAEDSFVINGDTVDQVWTVRNKTADESRKVYTAYQFLLRFTPQERAAYRLAAKTDDTVADFMALAQAAQEIVSDDPMTVAGMDYLVNIGILTEQRKGEILGS
jgi:ABC-type cobalamin/Fe3+-siderophores transport system ATPase subunit